MVIVYLPLLQCIIFGGTDWQKNSMLRLGNTIRYISPPQRTSLHPSSSPFSSVLSRSLRGPSRVPASRQYSCSSSSSSSSAYSSSSSFSSSTSLLKTSSLASLSLFLTSSLSSPASCSSAQYISPIDSRFIPIPLQQTSAAHSSSTPSHETTLQYLQRQLHQLWKYLKRFFYASKRITECSLVIGSALVIAPPALYFGKEEFLWQYIVDSIQYLGPTFIKLAQWASSRPDLFP